MQVHLGSVPETQKTPARTVSVAQARGFSRPGTVTPTRDFFQNHYLPTPLPFFVTSASLLFYSRLRCREERRFADGSTVHRFRSRGEQRFTFSSTVLRNCPCRGERHFAYGSTVHARVETESKSTTIIRVPSSAVNSFGLRVSEERFHSF